MMPDNLVELRERAAKALGWERRDDFYYIFGIGSLEQHIKCSRWRPDESHDQAALLLAEVERRGRQIEFCLALARLILTDDPAEFFDAKIWKTSNATALQKTKAALAALE